MRFTILALTAAAAVSAIPEVTVVPKENTCSNWPFFRQTASIAGPFSIFADSTGTAIDGNRGSYVTISDPSIATGRAVIASQPGAAASQVQCQAFGAAEMLAMNVDGAYQPLSISEYIYHQYDGLVFVKTVARGAPIEPHWHYYPNGTRQDGTFLGWNNFTTWAYLLDSQSPLYSVRLLTDTAQTLRDGEFAGFIRAGDPSLPN
ncbi:hypothetical protein F5Y19DRAFT_478290 [Xylariaceae sp. FL1651]|nr:hypothetical protein F5Y19DRAFT_478290 [Xylariaceae sp. FL1651]